MRFETPAPGIAFDIPDEWWAFAEMDGFTRRSDFYPPDGSEDFEKVALADIMPPARFEGVPLFKKYKLVPVLFAFQSPECSLPVVKLLNLPQPQHYRYAVFNGFHRFYASSAVGFTHIPARIYPLSVLEAV